MGAATKGMQDMKQLPGDWKNISSVVSADSKPISVAEIGMKDHSFATASSVTAVLNVTGVDVEARSTSQSDSHPISNSTPSKRSHWAVAYLVLTGRLPMTADLDIEDWATKNDTSNNSISASSSSSSFISSPPSPSLKRLVRKKSIFLEDDADELVYGTATAEMRARWRRKATKKVENVGKRELRDME